MAILRNRSRAIIQLDRMRGLGYSDTDMMDILIGNYLSGEEAYNAMEYIQEELGLGVETEEEIIDDTDD
jgi:hypothetical protein